MVWGKSLGVRGKQIKREELEGKNGGEVGFYRGLLERIKTVRDE